MSAQKRNQLIGLALVIIAIGAAGSWWIEENDPVDRTGTDEFINSVGSSLAEAKKQSQQLGAQAESIEGLLKGNLSNQTNSAPQRRGK